MWGRIWNEMVEYERIRGKYRYYRKFEYLITSLYKDVAGGYMYEEDSFFHFFSVGELT